MLPVSPILSRCDLSTGRGEEQVFPRAVIRNLQKQTMSCAVPLGGSSITDRPSSVSGPPLCHRLEWEYVNEEAMVQTTSIDVFQVVAIMVGTQRTAVWLRTVCPGWLVFLLNAMIMLLTNCQLLDQKKGPFVPSPCRLCSSIKPPKARPVGWAIIDRYLIMNTLLLSGCQYS